MNIYIYVYIKHDYTYISILVGHYKNSSNKENLAYDFVGVEFYNEFIPCIAGSDFIGDEMK